MHVHPQAGARLQIAEVFRTFAETYRYSHPLGDPAARVLSDLEHCRTPALGHHLYQCEQCERDVPLYNSCLNRHCPTCQGPAQYRWIAERQRRLLNTSYFHAVFTLPSVLRPVVLAHRRLLLGLLFRSVAATLNAFATDPRWLGAQIAFTLVLHTWRRDLLFHPHLHAIITAGGLSPDGSTWVDLPDDNFLFSLHAVSRVFRGKFLHGFIELSKSGKLGLTEHQSRKLVREAKKQDWVVYAKPAFGGPTQIINYLGRYTHRVAISSSRLLSISEQRIVFRTRGQKTCSLPPEEFIHRFLLHVLPPQFTKTRHYGLLAPSNVNSRLRRAQQILGPATENEPARHCDSGADSADHHDDAARARDSELVLGTPTVSDNQSATERAAPRCPHCGGPLVRRALPKRHLAELPPPDT